ncbi:TetR/AcrR family transcriptional regulator [uncultured Vibrio sp.]|uniref:TetR/AcrR family transcriptional regulator n=1 Tax=uncultured Vibrio sp. TaxID=114054 RepID=UPI0025D6907F|nr:TetR/AcrR family transcriptional regulator [uncultured Vibrio sp.]
MARITAAEKEQTKKAWDAIIFQIFMTEGWDAVTYDRMAKETGKGKSSIQRYYESKLMFATALQGKVFPMAVQKLDFTSSGNFINSWMKAYHDKESHIFREVVKMLIDNIMTAGTAPQSRGAIARICQLLSQHMPEQEAEDAVKMVLGCTLYTYLES